MFIVFGGLAVASAVAVITRKNTVHAALLLGLHFVSVAMLYLTLQAEFIAILQIIVVAGAIMVLFLFVILLLNVEPGEPPNARRLLAGLGITIGAALTAMLGLAVALGAAAGRGDVSDLRYGTAEEVGRALFSRHVFAFEAVSVLLLAAMIGIAYLGRGWLRGRPRRAEGT